MMHACDEPPFQYLKILTLPTIWLWTPTAINTCRKKRHASATIHSSLPEEDQADDFK